MQLFFNMIVPFTICGVALYGAFHRVDVYSSLVQGAGEGLSTLVRIVPSLVGLMTAGLYAPSLRCPGAGPSWLWPLCWSGWDWTRSCCP